MNMLEEKNEVLCQVCGEGPSVVTCSACGKPICKKCRNLVIVGNSEKGLRVMDLCNQCRENPACNPSLNSDRVFSLCTVAEMVNNKQDNDDRFRLKLKVL